MKKIFLFSLFFGCTSSIQTRLDAAEAKLLSLESMITETVQILSECQEYNLLYRREIGICVYGLTEDLTREIISSGEEINMETIFARQEQACEFSCNYEESCSYNIKIACNINNQQN